MTDLIALGMQADELRSRLHPEGVVTYLTGGRGSSDIAGCVTPEWRPGMTGVEYLQLVAETRLQTSAAHVASDWRKTGLKVAQLALRFGADDFGDAGDREEEICRIILDAGFTPKRRDSGFRILYVR